MTRVCLLTRKNTWMLIIDKNIYGRRGMKETDESLEQSVHQSYREERKKERLRSRDGAFLEAI